MYQKEDAFILQIREYILSKLDDPGLNGETIGRHFGMSRVHLFRKMKALTDYSISDLVRTVRLQKAMELIKTGKMNLSEIAYATGFSSISHFSRVFKKAFGYPPSAVKQNAKQL